MNFKLKINLPARQFSILYLLFMSLNSYAQTSEENFEDDNDTEKFVHHKISLVISHTHIPKGNSSAKEETFLIVPSWGLNYEYWINHKWAVGLHNDMEISTYVIVDERGSEIERERPIISTIVGIYKPNKIVNIVAGFGREFEKNKNFWVIRLGIELEFELHNRWELSPGLIYDIKESVYDSWTIGLAVSKRF